VVRFVPERDDTGVRNAQDSTHPSRKVGTGKGGIWVREQPDVAKAELPKSVPGVEGLEAEEKANAAA